MEIAGDMMVKLCGKKFLLNELDAFDASKFHLHISDALHV